MQCEPIGHNFKMFSMFKFNVHTDILSSMIQHNITDMYGGLRFLMKESKDIWLLTFPGGSCRSKELWTSGKGVKRAVFISEAKIIIATHSKNVAEYDDEWKGQRS